MSRPALFNMRPFRKFVCKREQRRKSSDAGGLRPPRKFTAPGCASLLDTDVRKTLSVFNFIQLPCGHERRLLSLRAATARRPDRVSRLGFTVPKRRVLNPRRANRREGRRCNTSPNRCASTSWRPEKRPVKCGGRTLCVSEGRILRPFLQKSRVIAEFGISFRLAGSARRRFPN
jgi:hypothetical protein